MIIMENLDCFKENLKELMEVKNYTVKDISLKTGINTSSIYAYFNGRNYPNLQNAIKIAEVFDCSLDFLFGFAEDFTPKKYKPVADLNNSVKRAITNKGLTRYRVYILTGISQNELYGWYKGTKTPSLISLVAVAKALDCSLNYLAGRDEI